jgi:hypothetical protein
MAVNKNGINYTRIVTMILKVKWASLDNNLIMPKLCVLSKGMPLRQYLALQFGECLVNQ